MNNVTLILQAVGRVERQASEELVPLVYEELRRLATARLARESARAHFAAHRISA